MGSPVRCSYQPGENPYFLKQGNEMSQDPQLSMNTPEPDPYGKAWRAQMLEMIRDIAATTKKIYEQRALLELKTRAPKPRGNHPTYRRMDADRLVITAKEGKVECVYFILTPETAKDLGILSGQKGRIYDDLTCNPKPDGGRCSTWRTWHGCLRLRSDSAFDVPCPNDWEIYALATNEAGLLVKGELLESADPTL